MYKIIIPSVLVYMLVGVAVFCFVMKKALYVAASVWRYRLQDMKDAFDLLDAADYFFAVVAGAAWPLSLMVVAVMQAGDWLWRKILSKIILNSVSKQLEKENQK